MATIPWMISHPKLRQPLDAIQIRYSFTNGPSRSPYRAYQLFHEEKYTARNAWSLHSDSVSPWTPFPDCWPKHSHGERSTSRAIYSKICTGSDLWSLMQGHPFQADRHHAVRPASLLVRRINNLRLLLWGRKKPFEDLYPPIPSGPKTMQYVQQTQAPASLLDAKHTVCGYSFTQRSPLTCTSWPACKTYIRRTIAPRSMRLSRILSVLALVAYVRCNTDIAMQMLLAILSSSSVRINGYVLGMSAPKSYKATFPHICWWSNYCKVPPRLYVQRMVSILSLPTHLSSRSRSLQLNLPLIPFSSLVASEAMVVQPMCIRLAERVFLWDFPPTTSSTVPKWKSDCIHPTVAYRSIHPFSMLAAFQDTPACDTTFTIIASQLLCGRPYIQLCTSNKVVLGLSSPCTKSFGSPCWRSCSVQHHHRLSVLHIVFASTPFISVAYPRHHSTSTALFILFCLYSDHSSSFSAKLARFTCSRLVQLHPPQFFSTRVLPLRIHVLETVRKCQGFGSHQWDCCLHAVEILYLDRYHHDAHLAMKEAATKMVAVLYSRCTWSSHRQSMWKGFVHGACWHHLQAGVIWPLPPCTPLTWLLNQCVLRGN